MANKETSVIVEEIIVSKIYLVRKHKVMLDVDLAELYGVETKVLKQSVKRNIDRFPDDFMFELTPTENEILKSQIGTLKRGQHSKYLPYAFTEQGVAMLSSILNSKRAISVNIQIMRTFIRFRQILLDNTELRLVIEALKKKTDNNTKNIELVFQYLDELLEKKKIRNHERKSATKSKRKNNAFSFEEDIEMQSRYNYRYDELGNLNHDEQED